MVLSEELDGVLDELPPPLGIGDHRREPAGAFVPAADGQQGLQVLVIRFESRKLGVTPLGRKCRKIE